jgi:hypothetical protein
MKICLATNEWLCIRSVDLTCGTGGQGDFILDLGFVYYFGFRFLDFE